MEKRKLSNSDSLNSNSNGHFVYEDLGRRGIIEHQVSKLDTLAGIAIKYGVDVISISLSFSSIAFIIIYQNCLKFRFICLFVFHIIVNCWLFWAYRNYGALRVFKSFFFLIFKRQWEFLLLLLLLFRWLILGSWMGCLLTFKCLL